jgi:cyanate lyase
MTKKLDPVSQKVVEKCISEVVNKYVDDSKFFNADGLHYIRTQITKLVHERLGDEFIARIDVGLDLSNIKDLPFYFKIDIPKDKAEELLNKED